MRIAGTSLLRPLIGACFALLLAGIAGSAGADTIVDEWAAIKAPPPPKLAPVTVDPHSTALLVLDLVPQACSQQRRPRCIASLPQVAKLIAAARAAKALVVYSLFPGPTAADVLPSLKPVGGEPVVTSGPDKFIATDLEKILRDKGITTVIPVGTAANGAVLYTASHAALLGFNVVLPVDGMSATRYVEQYVAWNMVNAPQVANKTKLTAIDLIKF